MEQKIHQQKIAAQAFARSTMALGQNGITNGVHDAVNGASKAKTLPKSFDNIEDCIEAFGM